MTASTSTNAGVTDNREAKVPPPVSAPRVVALLALAAGVACAWGCGTLCPRPGDAASTPAGRLELSWPACRRLRVAEHTVRRDDENRLVVRIRFRNVGEVPYRAALAIRFLDEAGEPVPPAGQPEQHLFPPGLGGLIEWTSYTADAAGYVVRVSGAGLF